MKLTNAIFTFNLLLIISFASVAQKQTFDVVTYIMPKGWNKTVSENGIQLSTKDDGKGNYAAAVIVRSIATSASANDNFTDSWEKLVKGTVKVNEAPTISDMGIEKGWNCISGQANYTDGANKGLVTLITATGNSKMANVVIMTNTNKYQEDILAFVNSLGLTEKSTAQNKTGKSNAATSGNTNPTSIVGLWCDYHPKEYSGYIRTEYALYSDGSYLYRTKQWTILQKQILFIYESGTWTVKGNQLIISPSQGKGEYWSKSASGSSKEWGSRMKTTSLKLEKKTFAFELKYVELVHAMNLLLTKANESNTASYYLRNLNESLIDNPPGTKTGFENKSITSVPKSLSNIPSASVAINSPLLRKIWEESTSEKFITGNLNGNYTGGFLK